MGTKFCNLNLKGMGLLVPKGLEALTFDCAPNWTTVTSPNFQWGHTQRYAKALSAELEVPTLCTEYFDDDYVEFSMYEMGKRTARHVPATYEDLRRTKGNPNKFLSALGLNPLDAPILEKIFTVRDPEQAVCLMESFFGCPIWGVDVDCPPIGVPNPNTVRSFIGASCPVRATTVKRKAKKGCPPYWDGELGKSPCPMTNAFREDTVFCWGGDLNHILKVLRSWVKKMQKALEEETSSSFGQAWVIKNYQRQLDMMHFRVFRQDGLMVLKGIPICNVDADLPDLSRDFRCLTAVTRIEAETCTAKAHPRFDCGFAYGKKLICFGVRGENPRVMPDFTLESPWLNLASGELISAFETPAYWDAVQAVGSLLGFPIWPKAFGSEWTCAEEAPHLQVFSK